MKSAGDPAARYFSVSLALKLRSFSVKGIPKSKTAPALKVARCRPTPSLHRPPPKHQDHLPVFSVLDFSEAFAFVMAPCEALASPGSRSLWIQDFQVDPNFTPTGRDWVWPCHDVKVHKMTILLNVAHGLQHNTEFLQTHISYWALLHWEKKKSSTTTSNLRAFGL